VSAFDSVVLGFLEGLTEYLPVSSTGHLILGAKILGLESSDFLKTFEIAIQLGAILAVVTLYARKFFVSGIYLAKLLLAFLPTAVIGFIFYDYIKQMLGSYQVVLWSLVIGGLFLIIFEKWYSRRGEEAGDLVSISFSQAFKIGLAQSISIIHGVSRAAATIIGGMATGLPRKTAVEFSFLLAVPTMLAATGLDIFRSASFIDGRNLLLLAIGFLTSFLIALASIKFLLGFLNRHSFTTFGYYRIILSFLFWLVIL